MFYVPYNNGMARGIKSTEYMPGVYLETNKKERLPYNSRTNSSSCKHDLELEFDFVFFFSEHEG